MAEEKDAKDFPEISAKLAAPTKKSVFERQRAEAEAKRIREEAETAAVYEDFVKSFADDDDSRPGASSSLRPQNADSSGPRMASGPPKRHFAPSGRTSGPGSLGPPINPSKKRTLDGSRPVERGRDRGIFAFEDDPGERPYRASALRASDDEDDSTRGDRAAERAAAKPTLQISSLPLGTSPAVIKSMLPSNLNVDGIQVLPPPGPGGNNALDRKSMSAIVTVATDTPASDLDATVSSLQGRYVGWGFYLSVSRHLSSTTLSSMGAGSLSSVSSQPFGAQPVPQNIGMSLNRVPPSHAHQGGFAPPTSYDPRASATKDTYQVKVTPPTDIRQLKLINKTIESLLTHGPEFEALIMSRSEVQHEEKWAWIWNSGSPGAVWYRWRLWQIVSGQKTKGEPNPYNTTTAKLFDNGAPWVEPEDTPAYEFVTRMDELVSDSAYNSSEENDSGDEAAHRRRRQFENTGGPPRDHDLASLGDEQGYLNPFHRAKLTYLLTRLPISTARLRKGDVARVTAFAISCAGKGAEEVVDMLVDNVLRPLNLSEAAWTGHAGPADEDEDNHDSYGIAANEKKEDKSAPTMIALHLISDVLSASSTSGVRHAWRYRSLFETALGTRRILVYLGRLEKELAWGRLRAEKWKRSVNGVLQLWEGWCVFPAAAQEKFGEEFNNPPLTEEEKLQEEQKHKRVMVELTKVQETKSKWKTVDLNETVDTEPVEEMDIDGEAMPDSDADGSAPKDDDVDGEPMDEEDLDGVPMDTDEESVDGGRMLLEEAEQQPPKATQVDEAVLPKAEALETTKPQRVRPKAMDMFADDSE